MNVTESIANQTKCLGRALQLFDGNRYRADALEALVSGLPDILALSSQQCSILLETLQRHTNMTLLSINVKDD